MELSNTLHIKFAGLNRILGPWRIECAIFSEWFMRRSYFSYVADDQQLIIIIERENSFDNSQHCENVILAGNFQLKSIWSFH